jgi:hypothetical protein
MSKIVGLLVKETLFIIPMIYVSDAYSSELMAP